MSNTHIKSKTFQNRSLNIPEQICSSFPHSVTTSSFWLLTLQNVESSLIPLVLSLLTTKPFENPVDSTSKICPGPVHSSPPPLWPLWYRSGLLQWSYWTLLPPLPFQMVLNIGASVILLKCRLDPSLHKSLRSPS